jgi:hypothetical protein
MCRGAFVVTWEQHQNANCTQRGRDAPLEALLRDWRFAVTNDLTTRPVWEISSPRHREKAARAIRPSRLACGWS